MWPQELQVRQESSLQAQVPSLVPGSASAGLGQEQSLRAYPPLGWEQMAQAQARHLRRKGASRSVTAQEYQTSAEESRRGQPVWRQRAPAPLAWAGHLPLWWGDWRPANSVSSHFGQ